MSLQRVIAFSVLLLWYAIVGHARCNDWTSELTLWARAVKISPTSPQAHLNLAKAFGGVGREVAARHHLIIMWRLRDAR